MTELRPTDDFEDLNYDIDDEGVLQVELDRPDELNSLTMNLIAELDELFRFVDTDDLLCVLLEGAGDKAFCAGADIGEISEMSVVSALDDAVDYTRAYDEIYNFDRPTIAKIDGYCLGGGLELALSCDLRVASNGSQFGLPEIELGLLPGAGGTQRLIRLIGETRAKDMVFRGEFVEATEAEELGLINSAVEPEEIAEEAERYAGDIVEGPPIGLKVAKQIMNEGAEANLDAAMLLENQGFGLLVSTEDAADGYEAFNERRDPEFKGK